MGKKKSNASNAARLLESSVAPILELEYQDPLFTIASHQTKPILFTGQATGHVQCYTYDGEKLEQHQQAKREELLNQEKQIYSNGKSPNVKKSVSQSKTKWWTVIADNTEVEEENLKINWKTKRHKGSCRHAIFDPLENSIGYHVYTCGSDNIIKKALTETGKVTSKVDVSSNYDVPSDKLTKLCHSATHPFLLAGTEEGNVLVYDSSDLKSTIKFNLKKMNDDSINHILPMPGTSAYHFLTLGSTTLSHIDIRKGIVTQSDDQEDELLSMCYTTDEISENKNDTVLVSHGEGIVTMWKNSKNKLMDQLTRIKINKEASIDCIIPTMNNDDEDLSNSIWCGDSEGLLHRVNYKRGKIVETRVHSSAGKSSTVDEVGMLEIDYNYRLISAGMDSLKIWSNKSVEEKNSDISEDENESVDDDDDVESISNISESQSDGSSEEFNSEDESDLEEVEAEDDKKEESLIPQRRTKQDLTKILSKPKRKTLDINKMTRKNQPVDEAMDEPASKKPKLKEKQLTSKQIRNMQKHEHGIRKFDDL